MEYSSALFQALLTVIVGVVVYALGEVTVKFFIEPVNRLSETVGEVLDTLVFYSNVYTNPVTKNQNQTLTREEIDDRSEAQKALRQKSTLLSSRANTVRLYGVAAFFRAIPTKNRVDEACRELIYLSNSCFTCNSKGTFESDQRIRILLTSRKPAPKVPVEDRVIPTHR
jgi:hypothetical protein